MKQILTNENLIQMVMHHLQLMGLSNTRRALEVESGIQCMSCPCESFFLPFVPVLGTLFTEWFTSSLHFKNHLYIMSSIA